jgi:glyoxylase-like metal-dependent hydrolase (beta-lactamase superfamily II)
LQVDVGEYRASRAAIQLDGGLWQLDLGFQGRGGVVAAYLLVSRSELALIETGPASTIEHLRRAVRAAGFPPERITRVLVTHIHLDHSGAAGVLARDNPDLIVSVHPVGRPHLIDPSRLVNSASRIYGDRMDPLWGEVAGIREEQVQALADGERLEVAGRQIDVVFTPGHASHHVVFHDSRGGTLFTGDTGGVRMPGTGYVCPPTPPPDLDPAAWLESVRTMRGLGARRICPTHFGSFDDAPEHLLQLERNIQPFVELGLDALERGAAHDELTAMMHGEMAARLGDVPEGILTNLEWATPSYMAALGLMRLAKQTGRQPTAEDRRGS